MMRKAGAVPSSSLWCLALAALLGSGCTAPVKMQTPGPSTVVAARAIGGDAGDFGTRHPGKYSDSVPLRLVQFWKGPEELPSEAGRAYVGVTEQGVSLYAHLGDGDIFSHATADGQPMPALGDVVEFFVKPGVGRSDYWEIHVTPNDFLLDIHVPDRVQISRGGGITWEQVEPFTAPSSQTTRRVVVKDGSWAVEITVPWSAFGLDSSPASGEVWQFAVCRFNYTGGLDNPELSSTAPITELNFHRFEEYTDLVFGEN